VPAGFESTAGGQKAVGLGNVELAAKYRFLHQDTVGRDVVVFPRVFLPSGSGTVGDNRASLLLLAWIQRDWTSAWSTFGGAGCVISTQNSRNFCLAGAVLTYQVLPKLQIGAEFLHQTADANGTPPTSSLGLGFRYDLDDNYHLLGYVRRGIQNASETDQYSWYAAVLLTF
jgi:hypothetical protein